MNCEQHSTMATRFGLQVCNPVLRVISPAIGMMMRERSVAASGERRAAGGERRAAGGGRRAVVNGQRGAITMQHNRAGGEAEAVGQWRGGSPGILDSAEPDHGFQSTRADSAEPDHGFQSTCADSAEPDHGFQSTCADSAEPDHGFQSTRADSTEPDHTFRFRRPSSPAPGHFTFQQLRRVLARSSCSLDSREWGRCSSMYRSGAGARNDRMHLLRCLRLRTVVPIAGRHSDATAIMIAPLLESVGLYSTTSGRDRISDRPVAQLCGWLNPSNNSATASAPGSVLPSRSPDDT